MLTTLAGSLLPGIRYRPQVSGHRLVMRSVSLQSWAFRGSTKRVPTVFWGLSRCSTGCICSLHFRSLSHFCFLLRHGEIWLNVVLNLYSPDLGASRLRSRPLSHPARRVRGCSEDLHGPDEAAGVGILLEHTFCLHVLVVFCLFFMYIAASDVFSSQCK